jgi:hypothetical protein
MVNGITWEELTQTRLLEAKKKQQKAKDTAKQAEIEANRLEEYIKTLERVLELDKQQSSITLYDDKSLNLDNLLKQSTWQNLRAIMALNNGLLVVIEAVDFLIHAKVFSDRDHARNVIYSTLHAHKKDLEWVRKGVYRLKKPSERTRKRTRSKATPSLKRAILEIIKANPTFTKADVTRALVKNGFNFKGKNPGKAVNLTWLNMGYGKREPAQEEQARQESAQQALIVAAST